MASNLKITSFFKAGGSRKQHSTKLQTRSDQPSAMPLITITPTKKGFSDSFTIDDPHHKNDLEAPFSFDGPRHKKDFEAPFISQRSPPKKLFPAIERFDIASFKHERAQAIQRTEEAIAQVVHDLCDYIDRKKGFVHKTQSQLVDTYGPEVLADRYIKGAPSSMKAILGKEGGIDYFELADLDNDPSCQPDYQHCGSYFLGGTPIHPPLTPKPLPIHCGESANAKGMKTRKQEHVSETFRRTTKSPLPVYSAIDNPANPLKAFVVVTCKEKVKDKSFEHFAEAVTRQLLGTNVKLPAFKELNALPSYGVLKFIQPVQPWNHSQVLREGDKTSGQSEVLSERQAVDQDNRRDRHTENEFTRRERARDAYVCPNCESSDSMEWYKDRDASEDLGDRYCSRCEVYHQRHGSYPSPEELRRLVDQAARVASIADKPAPGHCENPKCGWGGKADWTWNSVLQLYLCVSCGNWAKANNDQLRVPKRPYRKRGAEPTQCANDGCQATETYKWYSDKSLEGHVCKSCYVFKSNHGRYPDYVSGKDRKRAKKRVRK